MSLFAGFRAIVPRVVFIIDTAFTITARITKSFNCIEASTIWRICCTIKLLTEICPYTFEDALIFTNLELFRQDGLKKMGAITTIANLLKNNPSAVDLQKAVFDKLEKKSGFQKADFANSLLYKDDFSELTAPAYIQEGLLWLKECLDSNGTSDGK